MFLFRWPVCCFLLAFHKSAYGWAGYDVSEVTCSQGLSECTVADEMPLGISESDGADVQMVTAKVEVCCENNAPCTLCLLVDAELSIHVGEDVDKSRSGHDTENDREGATISTVLICAAASVTLCYKTPPTFPACKRVDFTVCPTELKQKVAKVSLVITNPAGVSFSSIVYIYPSKALHLIEVVAPSLNEVCSQNLQKSIKDCYMPTVNSVINQEMNQVELKLAGRHKVCIQYEADGRCQSWESKTIPLHSVTPCLCLQVWDDDKPRRSQSCPFKNMGFLQKNVWQNLTASVRHGRMNNKGQMLLWNLSAPCRLEGEVWPCRWTSGHRCTEIEGFRQQLGNTTWEQNSDVQWVKIGVFEDINLQLSPCVMVNLRGGDLHLGPFCSHQTARWRWNLLAVAVLLVIALAALMSCLRHDFVKIGRKGHVVLLSPPDIHDDFSEVCGLGSLLKSQGFSVSVDQWSRMEQCNLGPLPWLHSQLLHVKNLGGRAVLILTRKALGLAHEWSRQQPEALQAGRGDGNVPQSPYSDVFLASLCLILVDKRQGRTGERFLLVTFDQDVVQPPGSLPEPFQGLHLFQLPSQMKTLLCELAGGGNRKVDGGKSKAGWKWGILDGWKLKTKHATCSQGTIPAQCKYSGI
ncbi:interleukin-17 receptor C isoform X1 [Phycodurus eques]|uniref:interleukin-17 receptor C isoform X1 n=1 Tax=Phycodurus eques TaxID=693459 RepID=UPI002ACE7487|nr:interleukin-17 receptor C isoform X1 [Phycodurus eques]